MCDARTLIGQVSEMLEKDRVRHRLSADDAVIRMGFRGKSGGFPVIILAREGPLALLIVFQIPLLVPEAKRPAMAEALTRANYALGIGRFEMDFSDGELLFTAAIPLADASLTGRLFRTVLCTAMDQCDDYHRAFGRLLFNDDLSAAEVIAEVEMAAKETDREVKSAKRNH